MRDMRGKDSGNKLKICIVCNHTFWLRLSPTNGAMTKPLYIFFLSSFILVCITVSKRRSAFCFFPHSGDSIYDLCRVYWQLSCWHVSLSSKALAIRCRPQILLLAAWWIDFKTWEGLEFFTWGVRTSKRAYWHRSWIFEYRRQMDWVCMWRWIEGIPLQIYTKAFVG